MGFYPVTPATDQYIIGGPLFKKVRIKLENGNNFIIQANNNSGSNFYIESTELNGKPYTHSYLTFDAIQDGGRFIFNMSVSPDKSWGNKDEDLPYSLSK